MGLFLFCFCLRCFCIFGGNINEPIPITDETWYYTYLVCDINEKIEKWASYAQLSKTYDGLGYYGYNKDLKCMIERLTFDQVLVNAKKRNRVLVNKLGV
jgi:hypothetical protein